MSTGPFDRFTDAVEGFERAVLAQTPVAEQHYDDEYFAADWREGDNRYDLETRRRIEDRNPSLIQRCFAPSRVLTWGAAPAS